jgi:twitching motility protein PilT
VAAVEVLVATARVREFIEDKDRTKEIADAINQGHQTYGMQSFDQSLMMLLQQNLVTYEEAMRQATNPDDFALRISGISGTSDSKWDDFEGQPSGIAGAVPQAAPHPVAPSPGRTPQAPAPPTARSAPAAKPAGTAPAESEPNDPGFEIERF